MKWRLFFLCTAVLWVGGLVWGQTALAHTRSQSFSSWQIVGGDVFFVFSVDARRITQLVPVASQGVVPDSGLSGASAHAVSLEELARGHLLKTLRVTSSQSGAQNACKLAYVTPSGVSKSIYRFSGKFSCGLPLNTVFVKITAFLDVSPTHIHMARLSDERGVRDIVLKAGAAEFQWSQNGPPPSSFWGIVRIGMVHVFGGLDHLVFLLALVIAARGGRMVFFCITGFTLGHTAILGLISYGFVMVNMRLVEALIGFTIMVLAIEGGVSVDIARKRALLVIAGAGFLIAALSSLPYAVGLGGGLFVLALGGYSFAAAQLSRAMARQLLPAMTLLFGLVHGAGFAAGFTALGHSKNALLFPLVGFNIGVEVAQLCVLGLVYGGGILVRQKMPDISSFLPSSFRSGIFVPGIFVPGIFVPGIFALGLFWFITRLWGGGG